MVDRVTAYAGALPSAKDILKTGQFGMIGLAKIAETVLGANTLVDGFGCTPTTPASNNIIVTPGTIYQLENLEATTWSALPADTAHSVVKQGVLLDPVTLAVTPPATVGYAQVYLIEVQYQDSDSTLQVLNYYNAANPSSPFYGPPVNGAGSGQAQSTARAGIAAVQIKAGVAAASGTQVAPTPDAGWTPLFYVTVANGQSTVTSGNIAQLSTAPFLTAHGKLPLIPFGVQNGEWVYAPDVGAANALVIAPSPLPAAYVAGQRWRVKIANANTGATTLDVQGASGFLGAKNVTLAGRNLALGDLKAGDVADFVYDGSQFQMYAVHEPVIDMALGFTVPGDFADLNAAWAWLTRRRISATGSVTFNLTASPQTYSGNVVLYHPDGLRVFITGAALTGGGYPTTWTVSGNSSSARASDLTTNLALARARWPSELHFTGGTGLSVVGNLGGLSNVLITGDGAGSGSGLGLQSGYVTLNSVAVAGFSNDGFAIYFAQVNGQKLASLGNARHGFECYSSYFVYGGSCYGLGNGVHGFVTIFGNSSYNVGVSGSIMAARGNGSAGIYCDTSFVNVTGATVNTNGNTGLTIIDHGYCLFDSANVSSNSGNGITCVGNSGGRGVGCTVSSNGTYGIYASRSSEIEIQPSSTIGSNGSSNVYAEYGANVYAVGTSLTNVSPAVNASGNGNAFIAN